MNHIEVMTHALSSVIDGLWKTVGLLLGSAGSFTLANSLPAESIVQLASGVTGWVLAIACIWVLVKTIKVLFAKLEEKDILIRQILEKQNAALQSELEKIDK